MLRVSHYFVLLVLEILKPIQLLPLQVDHHVHLFLLGGQKLRFAPEQRLLIRN